jgi:hypothetical protein
VKGVPLSGGATVDAVADHWGKLLAMYMHKAGLAEIVLTAADIEALGKDGEMEWCLVVQELADGLHIKLMSLAEAHEFAKQHKGGFGKS